MAKIALRVYTNEINALIESGQLEDAVAHCLHILEIYPRHVDTYRLLGKAYLEGKEYRDASDIFQRVLSSVPDDFIANVGMSIIREATGDLPAAIYHMERTFECQPSNQLIQEELRRLYGIRDGVEPTKTRLTRGALAHMYAHGNLYDQSAAELVAALKEEPHRLDLYVLLADMYFKLNKKAESIETSKRILEKLPNSLTANRILYLLLKDSKSHEADGYHERWISMEPYAEFISDTYQIPEYVPEHMVTLDRLESASVMGESVPEEDEVWPSSGQPAGHTGSESGKDFPDWLTTEDEGEEGYGEYDEGEPDWLSNLKGDEIDQVEEAGEKAGEESQEEYPDWMKAPYAAGQTTEEVEPAGEKDLIEEEALDWMKAPVDGEETTEKAEPTEGPTPSDEEELRDWMEEPPVGEVTAEAGETEDFLWEDEVTGKEALGEGFIDRLSSIEETEDIEELEPGEEETEWEASHEKPADEEQETDIPEWMSLPSDTGQQLIRDIPETSESDEGENIDELLSTLPEANEEADVPDLLKQFPETDEEPQAGLQEIESAIVLDEGIIEEMPEFSSAQPEVEEEAEPIEDIAEADIPEWLKGMSLLEEPPESPEGEPPVEDEGPESSAPSLEDQIAEPGDEVDWLQELGKPAHHPPAKPIYTDWLDTYQKFEEPFTEPQPQEDESALDETSEQQFSGQPESAAEPIVNEETEEGPGAEEAKEEWSQGDWLQYVPLDEQPSSLLDDLDDEGEFDKTETRPIETQSGDIPDREWLDKILQDEEEVTPQLETGETEEDAENLLDGADLDWIENLPAGKTTAEVKAEPALPESDEEEFEWKESLPESEEEPAAEPAQENEDWVGSLRQDEGFSTGDLSRPVTGELVMPDDQSPEEWLESFEKEPSTGVIPDQITDELEWLDTLDEETPERATTESVTEELTAEINPELAEEELEWLDKLEGNVPEEFKAEPEIEEPVESIEIKEEEEGEEIVLEKEEEEEEEITPDEEASAQEELREDGTSPEQLESISEDIPEWLKALTQEEDEKKPNWLKDINRPHDTGEITEEAVPNEDVDEWLKYLSESVENVTPDELPQGKMEEGEPEAGQEEETNEEPDDETIVEEILDDTEIEPITEAEQTKQEDLNVQHKEDVKKESTSDLDEMISKYSYLIRKGRDLEQVIDTIQETLAEHPRDSRLWQMLGDSFMRLDRLKEALDAYTKAEDLLR